MGSNSIGDYSWLDDVGGGSDGEFQWSLDGLGDLAPTSELGVVGQYGDFSCLENSGSRKRGRNESCTGTKSKACREKMRRDRLNDRFLELSSVLDPGRPPRSDKASILSDAASTLLQLKSEAQQLKEENEKLRDTIKDLKVEKNELRDEKTKLKADKERLEQQLRAMSLPPMGFMPHPIALHHHVAAAANFAAQCQASLKTVAPYPMYNGLAMWQPVDVTEDPKAVPPNA